MKLPRFLSTRLASALALGCALLAFAPLASAQAVKITTLNDATLDKFSKAFDVINADADAKTEMDGMQSDEELGKAIKSGGNLNDIFSTKFPKAAAVFKKADYTPDEYFAVLFSLVMAAQGNSEGVSDPAVGKANITYFNANQEKVMGVMGKMK